MSRDFFINGESMVAVKGRQDSTISSLTNLGLAEGPIRVTLEFKHKDINVDAWGGEIPADVQFMLASARISMSLIHFDRNVTDTCLQLSMAGAPAIGQLQRAGQRMGNNMPRFAPAIASPSTGLVAGNNYIGLNISSPVAAKPWRFFYTYLEGPPMEFPLGTEKSVMVLNWRAIPYTQDPYGNGYGAYGAALWDYGTDS